MKSLYHGTIHEFDNIDVLAERLVSISERIFEKIKVDGKVCSTDFDINYRTVWRVLKYLKEKGILIEKEKIENTIYYILAK